MAATGSLASYRYVNLFIWVAHAVMILGLVFINPNHYTTIDSAYYLESARNLLDGNGYTMLENGHLNWNSTFPPGYPVLIALVSRMTGIPVLWASKLVNLISSAVLIGLFCRWYGAQKAIFFSCLLLTGPFLKLWAHTWSEPLFLLLLCVWARLFSSKNKAIYPLIGSGIALMLVRYAGIFILLPAIVSVACCFFRRKTCDAGKFWWPLLLWGAGAGAYITLNYFQGGEYYGGPRFQERDLAGNVVLMFGRGILNEFLVMRDFHPDGHHTLFLIGLFVQLSVSWFLWQKFRPHFSINRTKGPPTLYAVMALSYLLFLFTLRLFSPFDPPGYRLLSPFTFLMVQGLMMIMSESISFREIRWHALVIIMCSWLELIPRDGFLQKITGSGPL